jgi:hypothetical protein
MKSHKGHPQTSSKRQHPVRTGAHVMPGAGSKSGPGPARSHPRNPPMHGKKK